MNEDQVVEELATESCGVTWREGTTATLLRSILVEFGNKLSPLIRADERRKCVEIARGEKVEFEATWDEGDRAYNQACDDIAAAIEKEEK